MLTHAAEDYLKSIYKLQEKGGKVSTGILAAYLNVKPASATGMIKKLKTMNLVSHRTLSRCYADGCRKSDRT